MEDLPVMKKCCFCVPIRHALITWGYVKLGLALTVLGVYILILMAVVQYYNYIEGDTFLMSLIVLLGLLLTTEIISHTLFLIGAHQKNVRLIKVYYYYAIFMLGAIILMSIVSIIFTLRDSVAAKDIPTLLYIAGGLSIFFSIVAQIFLVLSIRSEIIKLRSNCPYRFVKNENNPEGTINSFRDDEQSIYNGTTQVL